MAGAGRADAGCVDHGDQVSGQGPVLLDLDGTLTDSAPGILGSYAAALRALGHEPDPGLDMNFVIGPALVDVMPVVLAPYGDDRVALAVATYRRIYGESGWSNSVLYDGIEAVLKGLAGRRVFLATAKRVDFARRMLERFGVAGCFEGIHGSLPEGGLEHKPELIADIVQRYGLDPAACVMVGDRRYDITGAHANGMRAVGVLWGYGGRAELEAAGADMLVETPGDLLGVL